MAEFNSHIITNAGRNLLARALAGEGKVIFTKAAFGDQKYSGNLREVTELKNKKLDLNVMNIRNDNGTAVLTVQISNQNVDQSFQTEEFGVYAKIENDVSEVLYSYTTAVSADTFPNNRLGKTYESIQDIYMAISSDVEAEIYVRDGVIYLTRDIANQVYTETGLIPVGELKGRSNLEANKQYLAGNGHWYKNVGGDRTWNGNDSPDENFIPITWEELSKQIVKSNSSIKNEIVEAEERVIGKSYGGILNEAGQKYEGKTYYDKNTKKLFLCKRNNTDISANINNYIAMDSNSLLERLENLFSFNLIKSSQNKGYKFYTKNSYVGNYIDVSDTFSTVDFCLISPARSELTDAEARFINYQGFVNGKILINAYWLNGNSLEKKYSATPSNTLLTASCVAFVYGTLK